MIRETYFTREEVEVNKCRKFKIESTESGVLRKGLNDRS